MPLAVSATIFMGARASRSTKLCTCAANSASTSRWLIVPVVAAGGTPAMARSRISNSPVSSPIGRAPARHILMPLYWAGLCEAVSIAAGAS